MKTIYTALAITALLIMPSLAQERSAGSRTSVSAQQEETKMINELETLQGRLKVLQEETRRRMGCQQTTRVSTATGCADIPGLEAQVLNRVTQVNQAVVQPQTVVAVPEHSEVLNQPSMVTMCETVGEAQIEVCRSVNPEMMIAPPSSNN